MTNQVYVVGVGMSRFTKPCGDVDYTEFGLEAAVKALNDATINYDCVQSAVCGYVYGDSTSGQRVLYQLGMTQIPIINVNNNCSTGSTALLQARNAISSGAVECAMAIGFEKMERGSLGSKFTDRTNPLDHVNIIMATEKGFDAKSPPAAQIFGNAGEAYMHKYGATKRHLAKIAEKNHRHSEHNPYSQFRRVYTLDEIEQSPVVFGPLTKLQCCPTSDGASCAILANRAFVERHGLWDQAVKIVSQVMATDSPRMLSTDAVEWAGVAMTRRAASEAYKLAGITPADIQVIELHDCFSANELLTYDALGLTAPGKAHTLVDSEDNTFGGKYVINPSGGLISKGHPLGATGLAQCSELVWQLRNWAGSRQVSHCKYALQHNVGLGGAVVVTIYKKANDNASIPQGSYNPATEARPMTQAEYRKAASAEQHQAEFFKARL